MQIKVWYRYGLNFLMTLTFMKTLLFCLNCFYVNWCNVWLDQFIQDDLLQCNITWNSLTSSPSTPPRLNQCWSQTLFSVELNPHPSHQVHLKYMIAMYCVAYGVSWPSGLAYRTQVLVLAAECGFESRPWHLCPWARHLIIIASLHPGVKWVPVRAELVD